MSRRIIICDPEKCMGEQLCEVACSFIKANSLDASLSLIRVANLEPTGSLAITCLKCEDPPCVSSCGRTALRRSEKIGRIIVDETRCTGCGWCIEACEFGAMLLHPTNKTVMTCDFCEETGEPECVKICPYDALTYTTLSETANKSRYESLKRVIKNAV